MMPSNDKMFLDPEQPLHTCTAGGCNGCEVKEKVACHFNLKQLLHFYAISTPPFILGGWGLWQYGSFWFLGMVAIIIFYFAFIEIRVMCSHCPHYAEPGLNSLKCWANYGVMKLWKYRPGPMSKTEKSVFLIGMGIAFLYPSPFLFIQKYWVLGFLHIILVTGFFSTLKLFLCSQCMNFACPFNGIKEETQQLFFEKNPIVKEAWKNE